MASIEQIHAYALTESHGGALKKQEREGVLLGCLQSGLFYLGTKVSCLFKNPSRSPVLCCKRSLLVYTQHTIGCA